MAISVSSGHWPHHTCNMVWNGSHFFYVFSKFQKFQLWNIPLWIHNESMKMHNFIILQNQATSGFLMNSWKANARFVPRFLKNTPLNFLEIPMIMSAIDLRKPWLFKSCKMYARQYWYALVSVRLWNFKDGAS